MPYLHSVQCALPPHYYDQETLIDAFRRHWGNKFFNFSRIEDFHRHVLVQGRHLALPLEAYLQEDFEFRNNAWIRISLELLQEATSRLLEAAQLPPREISLIASTSSSGIAVPSLEARLMNVLPFSPDTKRLPLFGLGCMAGVAGLNRVADYLRGYPREAALFLSSELCSLTLQLNDLGVANLISTGLFGDGAAAVLLVGDEHPLAPQAPLRFEDSLSRFFPNTEQVMGWEVGASGFRVVLDSQVPQVVLDHYPTMLEELLHNHDLQSQDIRFYLAHPGGPKVLAAMEQALALKPGKLKLSWETLKTHGNMSSVSVLFVVHEFLKDLPPCGSWGILAAMGPAFSAELTLVKRN